MEKTGLHTVYAVKPSRRCTRDAVASAPAAPQWVNPSQLAQEARDLVQRRLPDYMMPASFVWLPEVPLTATGKIDRKALPPPDRARPELAQPLAVPRTALEHFLARVWCKTLGLDQIGVNDKFFELGGDSLLGAVVIRKIQEQLGEPIYIVALFEAPTIGELARYLNAHYGNAVSRVFGPTSVSATQTLSGQGRKPHPMRRTEWARQTSRACGS